VNPRLSPSTKRIKNKTTIPVPGSVFLPLSFYMCTNMH
jgi:hypothetical protein